MKRRKQWQPTPVLLPGESHGLQSMGHDWATSLHRFGVVVFSFSFISMHILISSEIFWLFSCMLFSLHMLEVLIVFFPCNWHLILSYCGQKTCLELFQFFLNLLRLDLWPSMWSVLEKCSKCTWEKGEIHCFGVKCPIDINQV